MCCHLFRNFSKLSVLESVNRFCAADFCVFDRDIQLSGKTKCLSSNMFIMRFTFRRREGREAEITAKFPYFSNLCSKDNVLCISRMLWALSEPFNFIKLHYIWMQFVEQETSLRQRRETFYYTTVIWRDQTLLGHQTSFQEQKRNCNPLIININSVHHCRPED